MNSTEDPLEVVDHEPLVPQRSLMQIEQEFGAITRGQ